MNDFKESIEKYKDWTYNIRVAGVSFKQPELEQIKDRDWSMCTVSLEPEPDNPYDSNAIKVVVDGLHIGYIPAPIAKAVVNSDLLKDSYQAALIYVTDGADGKMKTAKVAVRNI